MHLPYPHHFWSLKLSPPTKKGLDLAAMHVILFCDVRKKLIIVFLYKIQTKMKPVKIYFSKADSIFSASRPYFGGKRKYAICIILLTTFLFIFFPIDGV